MLVFVQGAPPPEGGEEGEKAEDRKQKENTAYAKKMVLRLAGFMGVGGAVAIVYIFGECLSEAAYFLRIHVISCHRWKRSLPTNRLARQAVGSVLPEVPCAACP